jgi:hypothetical protein
MKTDGNDSYRQRTYPVLSGNGAPSGSVGDTGRRRGGSGKNCKSEELVAPGNDCTQS